MVTTCLGFRHFLHRFSPYQKTSFRKSLIQWSWNKMSSESQAALPIWLPARPEDFNIIGLTSLYLLPPVSDLRNQPYRRADAVRRSVRRRFDDQNLRPINDAEMVMWWGKSGCDWMGLGDWNRSVLLLMVMDRLRWRWDVDIKATLYKPSALILSSVWSGVGSDQTTWAYTHCDVVWF